MEEDFEQQAARNELIADAVHDQKKVKDPRILTKSKFLNGLQCPKLLWTRCNDPESMPPTPEALQRIFNTGNQVGRLAVQRIPGGVYVSEEDFLKNIEMTRVLLSAKDRKPIYEAGVLVDRIYSRADILRPSLSVPDAWDVIEVKCSTSRKDVHVQDIAFQRYCYEKAGIRIGRCYLMHINNEYVRDGDIDVQDLFRLVDLTEETAEYMAVLPELIKGFLNIIDLAQCPSISIGLFCNKPYTCQMKPACWAFLPKGNVLELRGRKEASFHLLHKGVVLIADIPKPETLTDDRHIQYMCARSAEPYVEQATIRAFLGTLRYPLYFMDFETVSEAIPRFDGAWPYQQIPFQFSVHVQESQDAPLKHFSFLHRKTGDPRRPFLNALRKATGTRGSIVVYNRTFEESHVLKKMQGFYPEHAMWIDDLRSRLVDLLDVFRGMAYYHPDQQGSASIKKVLPVLTSTGYSGMAIADGGQAASEYVRVTYGEGIDPADWEKVYADLEAYCGLDTRAMADILKALRGLVGS